MDRGTIAKQQIRDQYASVIKDIENSQGETTCPAHEPLSRGVCLMMKYHLIQMQEDIDTIRIARKTLIKTIVGFFTAILLVFLFFKSKGV